MNDYGTFIGTADPATGGPDASPLDLLAFALDRFTPDGAHTTLTVEQLHGVVSYAFDALRLQTLAARNAADGRPEETR